MSTTEVIPDTAKEAPERSKEAVSSDKPVHEPAPTVRHLSAIVEEVIDNWPSQKNFSPQMIHDEAMKYKGEMTSRDRSASQQAILELLKKGKIQRLRRGRYIKTPATAAPKKAASKKTTAKKAATRKVSKGPAKPKKAAAKRAPTKATPKKSETPVEDAGAAAAKELLEKASPEVIGEVLQEVLREADPWDFEEAYDRMRMDLTMEGAFELYCSVVKDELTHDPEFWHMFGSICAHHDKMMQVVKDERAR